ncbi:hypothetical protein M378DRAFT_12013 [Amanita muscaria Koide BX008]|uniref:Uncharacterized protein n=1 Tax=Amanita muscaria (strain Koide BX008) TaxID=946122 RepID=A0A0C2WPJ5_AMAMK|nr:hypothetical protein M378DRAFT_12013 [Amanita muscaria Koide BX008]
MHRGGLRSDHRFIFYIAHTQRSRSQTALKLFHISTAVWQFGFKIIDGTTLLTLDIAAHTFTDSTTADQYQQRQARGIIDCSAAVLNSAYADHQFDLTSVASKMERPCGDDLKICEPYIDRTAREWLEAILTTESSAPYLAYPTDLVFKYRGLRLTWGQFRGRRVAKKSIEDHGVDGPCTGVASYYFHCMCVQLKSTSMVTIRRWERAGLVKGVCNCSLSPVIENSYILLVAAIAGAVPSPLREVNFRWITRGDDPGDGEHVEKGDRLHEGGLRSSASIFCSRTARRLFSDAIVTFSIYLTREQHIGYSPLMDQRQRDVRDYGRVVSVIGDRVCTSTRKEVEDHKRVVKGIFKELQCRHTHSSVKMP